MQDVFVILLIITALFFAYGWNQCDLDYMRLLRKYEEDMQVMNDRCTQQSLDHVAASKRDVQLMQQLRVENDALRKRAEDYDDLLEAHRVITGRLRDCVTKHQLGLGGEPLVLLVCDELDLLKAGSVVAEIDRISEVSQSMADETRVLLDLAKEAQLTGKMPDLSPLASHQRPISG